MKSVSSDNSSDCIRVSSTGQTRFVQLFLRVVNVHLFWTNAFSKTGPAGRVLESIDK